jgi:hypothetical protein
MGMVADLELSKVEVLPRKCSGLDARLCLCAKISFHQTRLQSLADMIFEMTVTKIPNYSIQFT